MPVPVGLPVTVWTNPDGEYAPSGPFLLADASGVLLADTSANNLIDSGIVVVPLAATVWSESDAA